MGMGRHSEFISSDRVEGADVFDPNGARIGQIDHLMIDKVSGVVRYAIMTFGGFLGIGEGQRPLPWKALRYDADLGGYVADVTARQLESAPEYSERSWQDRDWETRLHRHFGSTPYWDESGASSGAGQGATRM